MTLHWGWWLAGILWLLFVIFWFLQRNASLARRCARLENQNAGLQLLTDNLPFSLIELDVSGQIVRCQLCDGAPAIVPGLPLDEYLWGDSRRAIPPALAAARANTAPVPVTLVFKGYEGRVFAGHIAELPSRLGRVSTIIAFVDRSAEEEEKLRLVHEREKADRANEAKSRFLANMSHEIRTPMTGLLGMVSLMEQTPLSDEQQGFQRIIQSSSEHLLAIVNDILDISKIDAGKLSVEEEAFDLQELISNLMDMVSSKAQEKNLVLQSFVEDQLPPLLIGDPIRIRQILINFLNNALKFTNSGHVLLRVVQVRHLGSSVEVRFSVEDSGVGISADTAAYLFEEYTFAHGRMSRDAGGTGLGLSICQRLAKLMGGRVGVLSSPGVGSNFWFDITLSVAATDLVEPDEGRSDGSGARIWICDAQQVYRTLVLSVARRMKLQPRVLSSQDELVHQLESGQQTEVLVISRSFWDKRDERVKRWVESNRPRVVISGVHNLTDSGEGLMKEGACGYWEWPISQVHLTDLLNRVLKQTPPVTQLVTRFNRYQTSFGDESGSDVFTGTSVLLAEDNKVNQKVARQLLTKLGCKVAVADNGKQAVDLVAEQKFNLVLMDCHMPVMDGIDACRHIRAREDSLSLPPTPIVALSADVMADIKLACEEAGMDGYLAKPIRLEELRRELPRFLGGSGVDASGGDGAEVDGAEVNEQGGETETLSKAEPD